jgi:hypothetical protein
MSGRTNLLTVALAAGVLVGAAAAQADPTIPATPEDGGPLNWEVTAGGGSRLHTRPSTSAGVVANLPTGTDYP